MRRVNKVTVFVLYFLAFLNIHTNSEWRIVEIKVEKFINSADKTTHIVTPYEDYMIENKLTFSEDNKWVGSFGDINVTFEAINPLVEYYVGGHAAIIEDQEKSIETTGLDPPGMNFVKYRSNNWHKRHDYVIGLRVKGANLDDYKQALQYAKETLDDPYDYTFLPYNEKRYCTEVITYAWNPLGYNLNYDGLWVTVQDLVVSPKTYIYYVHYIDEDGNKVTYYMD